jgi:acetoin utilization deacetylase AcuC-like enzyme
MSTVFITHPACRRHEMGPDHPECFQRLDVITDMLMTLRVLDLLTHSEASTASREELLRVHDARYLDDLERILPDKGYANIDLDTRMCPNTLKAARYAAGSAVQAVNEVLTGQVKNAFCAVRPPGHHATSDTAMGFCFYNNVAVGAAHAIAEYDLERVAIVDFDVHHGNGTDEIFAGNEQVRLFSLYEIDLFPMERGKEPEGDGVYIPLPAGTGSEALRAAVETTWLPALEDFKPQLLMVSAGFDAHVQDDMSSLAFLDADFQWLTQVCLNVAERHAQGRLVSVLEGGYDLESLARCAAQHIKQLAGL